MIRPGAGGAVELSRSKGAKERQSERGDQKGDKLHTGQLENST